MMKKYKLFNPNDGSYSSYENLEMLKNDLPIVMLKFYLLHCHNNPYSVVTINNDSSETWTSPDNDDIIDFSEVLESLRQNIK
jgi:hypothetical protein